MFKLEQQRRATLFSPPSTSSSVKVSKEELGALLFERLSKLGAESLAGLLVNPVFAALDYVKLCQGCRAGKNMSLLFNPHRFTTKVKGSAAFLEDAVKSASFCQGLARALLEKLKSGAAPINALDQAFGFFINGVQIASDFPPFAARTIALRYGLDQHSSVLDPCAGWGGRMIGLSSVVNHYAAFDTSDRTVNGLRELAKFLVTMRPEFSAHIKLLAFEDSKLQESKFDLALTSPPYFDTEQYGGEHSSAARYASFELWVKGFFEPLILKTLAALKPTAVFILNIGDRRYPLSAALFKVCADNNFQVRKIHVPGLGSGAGAGLERIISEGEKFYEIKRK